MIENTSVWPFQLDKVEEWAFFNNTFTAEECQKIIELGESLSLNKGTLIEKNKKLSVDINYRNSETSWIYPDETSEWIYRRITDVVMHLNNNFFKFDLFGLIEGLQFTKYSAPDGNYKQHIDKVLYGKIRKLSISVQLTDPAEYEGGGLFLYNSKKPVEMQKEIGTLNAFPSYMLHEVKPVTKGTRYSLVAWVTGSPFK